MDPRRSLESILCAEGDLDVLLVAPEAASLAPEGSPFTRPWSGVRLADPNYDFMGDQGHEPHHGMLLVADALRQRGIRVDALDLNAIRWVQTRLGCTPLDSDQIVLEAIRRRQPRILGFSAMTANAFLAVRCAKAVKRLYPNVRTLLGGLAAEGDFVARDAGHFDAIYPGPLSHRALSGLLSLLGKQEGDSADLLIADGGPDRNSARQESRALSSTIEFEVAGTTHYELLPRELELIPRVFLSRGCAAGCKFCSPAASLGYRAAVRRVDDVVFEVAHVHECFDFGYWLFGDLTFPIGSGPAAKLLAGISRIDGLKPWWFQTQVRLANIDALRLAHDSGCKLVAFGFEDFGSPEAAVRTKHVSRARSIEACVAAKKAGLGTQAYWMFGFPNDSVGLALERVRDIEWFIDQGLIDCAHISFLVPYPGTELFDLRTEHGIKIVDERAYDLLLTGGGDYYNMLPVHRTVRMSENEIYLCTRLAVEAASAAFWRRSPIVGPPNASVP